MPYAPSLTFFNNPPTDRQFPKILPSAALNRSFDFRDAVLSEASDMRRIIIKEARPGMIAARSIANPNPPAPPATPRPLVATGVTLTLNHLVRLHESGIYDLWVNDPGLEFFDDLISTQTTAHQRRLANALQDSFQRLSSLLPRALILRHEALLHDTLQQVLRTAPAIPCFRAFTEDEALLAHSCDVLAVATLLGVQLENYLVEQRRRLNCRQAREVVNLALGALFHDLGELMLPDDQRESRTGPAGMLSDDWKRHTVEGYTIVHGRLDPSAAAIVLHHHQHYDGRGFAAPSADTTYRPLAANSIHVFARIVLVADRFGQSLFAAGSRLPQPLVKTLWELQQLPGTLAFDPVIHRTLMTTFLPFPEGTVVTLTDSRQALVMKTDPACPCFPEVRILRDPQSPALPPAPDSIESCLPPHNPADPLTLNLADCLKLSIHSVDNTAVEQHLYGLRKAQPLIAA
jgi:HD-GYP domain-containing protein (c-di-GMP phosphodiesterase class II)